MCNNIAEKWRGAASSDEHHHHGGLQAGGIVIRRREQHAHENLNCGPKSKQLCSKRRQTPSMMMAYLVTLLAAVVSTASASSRSAAGSGSGGGSGGSSSRSRSTSRSPPADPRLSQSLRNEAASLASGKQMLNEGLSILGGALDGGDVRRKTGMEYGEEGSDADDYDDDDDPLINGDDLALLDSIFGSSSAPSSPSTSASSTSSLPRNAQLSEAAAYDDYDPFIGGAVDDDIDGMDLVDDDEIDGLFERAGKLLEAEEGEEDELNTNLPGHDDFGEVGQYYDDDQQEEGQKDVYRSTTEDVLLEAGEQIDNSWEGPNDNLYEYDLYDEYEYLPDGDSGGADDNAPGADAQWETEYPHQDGRYDGLEAFEEFYDEVNGNASPPFDDAAHDSPAEEYDYGYNEQGRGEYQEEPEVGFDDNVGYEYEYDYTDPTLAMEGVDEQPLHDAGSQQMPSQDQEYKEVSDDYQQNSSDHLQLSGTVETFLEEQDDEEFEFDAAFADAAIAAARMEEEEQREFEAEANADNTDNAADFDYIYEDRTLYNVDDENTFVADGSPRHPHHPVPPVHAADSTIDGIIRAHRIAVAKDLGMEPPTIGDSSPSVPTNSVAGAQQRQTQYQGTYSKSKTSSDPDQPRGFGHAHNSNSDGRYNRSPAFAVRGSGGGGAPFDDPEREQKIEARRQKHERNFRRETAADVHKTFSTAVASVIRGDASPHVPANLFGQTLEEERAGCKLAGLSPEFDRNGMRNGKFCSDEELQTYVEWSSLLQSTWGEQCGAVDIGTAKAKLYGGAQYHRSIRCFSALLLTLPLPEITEEELLLLLTASGSAGSGSHGAAGHDGPDLLRTAAILCRTKMEGLVRVSTCVSIARYIKCFVLEVQRNPTT